MAESNTKLPVIINADLQDSEVALLLHRQYKVRISESTMKQSCIFPLSSVAFIVSPLHEMAEKWPVDEDHILLNENMFRRIDKMTSLHKTCYLVCATSLYAGREKILLQKVQKRLLCSRIQLVPVHNTQEIVSSMSEIAKKMCKVHAPEEKTNITGAVDTGQIIKTILQTVGISSSSTEMAVQSLGNFQRIIKAPVSKLVQSGLNRNTAEMLHMRFSKDQL